MTPEMWLELEPIKLRRLWCGHISLHVLHGARALTSNRMLPHCGFEGLCTLGLRQ